MLLKVVGECLTNSLLYGTSNLAVTQLGLGLSLELGLSDLDRDDSCETLTEVVASQLNLSLLNLLTDIGILVSLLLKRTGQCHTEALQVGTTLDGVDVVDVGVDIL